MRLSSFIYELARILTPRDSRLFIHKIISFLGRNLSDEEYLKRMYKFRVGRELNLTNPKTFNEKIQWLKLNDHRPEYTVMADKYAVKKFVSDRIGSEYVIPLIGVWDNPDDIDFSLLPEQFVMKCTHDSGLSLSICRDKSRFDFIGAKRKAKKVMKYNYFAYTREWAYKNIKPRVIIEEYMQDGDSLSLPVYKFFTFGGEPKIVQVIQGDKTKYETINYFDAS